MNVISPKSKFVMKIFFKPIMTSALLSDDQELPTLDSFWYMTSQLQFTDPNNLPGTLKDRLLLGTYRNHPEPSLPGHSLCKYGKSILKNSRNFVK